MSNSRRPEAGPQHANAPPTPERPLSDWGRTYVAHPYLWAGILLLAGLLAAGAGVWRHSVFGFVVGVGIVVFGLFIESLNAVDSIWRRLRSRGGRSLPGG